MRMALNVFFFMFSLMLAGLSFGAAYGAEIIPARVAIAPVQIVSAKLELPDSSLKRLPQALSRRIGADLARHMNESRMFTEVMEIREDAMPSYPTLPEIAQAGRDMGADVVLTARVLGFEGGLKYGFRSSFFQDLTVEIAIYEVSSGVRLWHGKDNFSASEGVNMSSWSLEMIETKFIDLASRSLLPEVFASLVAKAGSDMAGYKPPVLEKAVASAAQEFSSDVDRVPRVQSGGKENSYAVIIGIEKYRDIPEAEYAARDARLMKEYLVRVLGYPEQNIAVLINDRATKSDIDAYLSVWLKNRVDRDSSVFLYFAGHGASVPKTGEAFLVPYEAIPSFIEKNALSLKSVYQTLAALEAKDVMVVMDACFSGAGGRSVVNEGQRPISISIENPLLASNNIIVLAAASETEISLSFPEKRHGLFTYFFLKGLQGEADSDANSRISIGELYEYVYPRVSKVARDRNLEQTTVIYPGIEMLGVRAGNIIGYTNR